MNPPPTDPLDLLQRLRVAVLTRQLPDSVAMWLQHGIDAYMTNSGPLDECLGLRSKPGKRNPPNRARLENRDELIRRAARNMEGSTWQQAGVLVQAVEDLDAVQAAGINFKDGANRALLPASLGGCRLKYLEEMRRCQMDIPRSQRHIARILSGHRD